MPVLHRISKNMSSGQFVDFLESRCEAADGILLCQDAVYMLLALQSVQFEQSVYALEEDLLARGLSDSDSPFPSVDFTGFVELASKYNKTISW